MGIVAAILAAAVGGCAAMGPCASDTRGWFSGWGASAGTSFTVGLRRTWDPCQSPETMRKPEPFTAPSADPASEVTAGPLPPPR